MALSRPSRVALIVVAGAAAVLLFVPGAVAWAWPHSASYGVELKWSDSYGWTTYVEKHPQGVDGGGMAMVAACDSPCVDPGAQDPTSATGSGFVGDPFVGRPVYNWAELSNTPADLVAMTAGYGTGSQSTY
ncbi:MAG: hypothetical protein ACYDBQ_12365, partial [Thermoplasmatota archaeon]